jgi:hypothetical protein
MIFLRWVTERARLPGSGRDALALANDGGFWSIVNRRSKWQRILGSSSWRDKDAGALAWTPFAPSQAASQQD